MRSMGHRLVVTQKLFLLLGLGWIGVYLGLDSQVIHYKFVLCILVVRNSYKYFSLTLLALNPTRWTVI